MELVILAAACVGAFAILFKQFGRQETPLLPAIAVNYLTAFACGLVIHPPWVVGDLSMLWVPAAGLGCLFFIVFVLIGISAQRAGAAATTIAGRMSLVLTVLVTMYIFHERIGVPAWIGIGLAIAGLVLTAAPSSTEKARGSWIFPILIFFGSGACDICVSAAQRVRTTTLSEGAFTTICFGAACLASMIFLFVRGHGRTLTNGSVWSGGVALGIVNFASLHFLVAALGRGQFPASIIFPLMNICAILFSTLAAMVLFRERLSVRQWVGLVLCVVALLFIMVPA